MPKRLICLLLALCLLSGTVLAANFEAGDETQAAAYIQDTSYLTWSQREGPWAEMPLGNVCTMKSSGCLITTMAILMCHSGVYSTDGFDPGVLAAYLDSVGLISHSNVKSADANLDLDRVDPEHLPRFIYEGYHTASGLPALCRLAGDYMADGYAVAAMVRSGRHYVAVTQVLEGDCVISDPYYGKTRLTDWAGTVMGILVFQPDPAAPDPIGCLPEWMQPPAPEPFSAEAQVEAAIAALQGAAHADAYAVSPDVTPYVLPPDAAPYTVAPDTVPEPVFVSGFPDLAEAAWYYAYVVRLERAELFRDLVLGGSGALDPQTPESRGNVAQLLYNLWTRRGGNAFAYAENRFSDVPVSDSRGPAIAWAQGCGIVEGYGNGRFGPEDNVTREQLCALLCRLLQYAGVDLPEGIDTFSDQDLISSWAVRAVGVCQALGLVEGDPGGTFRPQDTVTRAETCAVICRLWDLLASRTEPEAPGVEEPALAPLPEDPAAPDFGPIQSEDPGQEQEPDPPLEEPEARPEGESDPGPDTELDF